MRQHRPRPGTLANWPPPLRHLIRAAEDECPEGHAQTLLELTALALRKVPSRGIFDPTARGEHDIFVEIEAAAVRHLDLAAARTAWRTALEDAALALETRDDLERIALQVQSISDTAYFYAGLAFGFVALSVYRG